MLGPVARLSAQLGRNVMRTTVRNGSNGGVVGENLPFDVHNKKRLTFHFFWFFGTGFAAPFLVMFYQLRKNSNS